MNLSAEHLVTVAVIVFVIAVLVAAARMRPGPWTVVTARTLAVIVLVNQAGWWVSLYLSHSLSVSYSLPLQLCDVAAGVTAAALWFRTPILVELTYFWGIAGTANGLITPDISSHFPTYLFVQYFLQHGAIVGSALFLVLGLKISPRPWSSLRAFGLTVVLMVVDALANLLTDGNYLYLRYTPGVRSLLNVMGPWPRYIVGAAVLALVLFLLLELPFRVADRVRTRPDGEASAVPLSALH